MSHSDLCCAILMMVMRLIVSGPSQWLEGRERELHCDCLKVIAVGM